MKRERVQRERVQRERVQRERVQRECKRERERERERESIREREVSIRRLPDWKRCEQRRIDDSGGRRTLKKVAMCRQDKEHGGLSTKLDNLERE